MNSFPDHWQLIRLDDIGEFKNGINKDKEDFGFGAKFVNLMDVFGKNEVRASASFGRVNASEGEIDNFNLKVGDVLFIRSSVKPEGVGLTAVVVEDLYETVYSGFLIRFRPNAQLDSSFARYCFDELDFRQSLLSKSTVSANTNINQVALKSLQLPLPPLPEQRAIAAILSTWDEAITLTERLIAALRQRKQALMQMLLTGEVRFPGFEEEWEQYEFSKIASRNGTQINPLDAIKDLPCVELEHIAQNTGQIIGFTSLKAQKSIKNRFSAGQVLFGKLRPYLRKFAQPDFEGAASSEIWVLAADPNQSSNDFLFYLIQSDTFSSAVKVTSGTKMPRADWDTVANTFFWLPNHGDQAKIVNLLQNSDKELSLLRHVLEQLQVEKRGLMQQLLTGAIRVDVDE